MKQNNNKSGVSCRNENQDTYKYMVDNKIFLVNPVYRKTGENIREILIKLMKTETQKL